MSSAFGFSPRSILSRDGAAGELGSLLDAPFGGRRLFVTDPGLRKRGLCDAAPASLSGAGREVAIFDAVEAAPAPATLEAAIVLGREAGATGVVGFGGGSSLEVAKLAALILGAGEHLDGAWGVNQAKGPRLPLALIPTTAGAGSEATPVAIATLGEIAKRGVSSPAILPDLAIRDAELTRACPRRPPRRRGWTPWSMRSRPRPRSTPTTTRCRGSWRARRCAC